jgi:WD40 repeat protein
VRASSISEDFSVITLRRIAIVFVFVMVSAFSSFAQKPSLYISNESHNSLELLNLNTSALTTLYTVGTGAEYHLDDLTLNSAGQLIYSVPQAGLVNLYDPVAKTNTTLVSGEKWVRDLVIEPGGQTILMAIYSPGSIVRYNFATKTTTTLIKKLVTCDGIAYDPFGNLYAVANHNTIVQINPATGAIIATLTLEPHSGVNGGDGLTYDPYTGSLWATHDGKTGAGLLEIPVVASGFKSLNPGFTFFPSTLYSAPDGIKSDGKGNLYVGSIWTAFVYNIPTNTVTQNIVTMGADGVSLVPGTY